MKTRSLLDIASLSKDQIRSYLDLADQMDPHHAKPLLAGKRIILLFYESSTRTRSSFEIAAKALGATTVLITAAASSIEKSLGRMFVHAVSGVDDRDVDVLRQRVRRARRRMAHDDGVGVQSAKSVPGIQQRLAFFDTRRRGSDQDRGRTERFCGDLK